MRRLALAAAIALGASAGAHAAPLPPIGHVFVIVLENEGYGTTFGAASPAPYLARTLPQAGALLRQYHGVGHYSLGNYLAMISGQGLNPETQDDCPVFTPFRQTGTDRDGQAIGSGCVYPPAVDTVAGQLRRAGRRWRGYMEDMGRDPAREAAACAHPPLGGRDPTQRAEPKDQYATRHDPFVYFHSIIDRPDCVANVVPLTRLPDDLAGDTPDFVFVTPNLCHDGHDGGPGTRRCADGEPGGLVSADAFLGEWVPRITQSAAFRKDGLLIVTFDESDFDADRPAGEDAAACCGEVSGPNLPPGAMLDGAPDRGPGIAGPGGGRIGAVLLSPFIRPGTVSDRPYNHYSLLRSIETVFGLPPLGYAGAAGITPFGADVFGSG